MTRDIRNKLRSSKDVLATQLEDPEVREEWDRTAIARAVALSLIRYRARHGISQTALARLLGMKQPAVARLEQGERSIKLETLMRIASKLGMTVHMEFSPDAETPRVVEIKAVKHTHRKPSANVRSDYVHESARMPFGGRFDIVTV